MMYPFVLVSCVSVLTLINSAMRAVHCAFVTAQFASVENEVIK